MLQIYFYELNLALQNYFPSVCVLILDSSFCILLLYIVFLSSILSGLSLRSQETGCSSGLLSCSLSWQCLRVQMSGLSFGERTRLFGRSNTDLNFVMGDDFL